MTPTESEIEIHFYGRMAFFDLIYKAIVADSKQ